MADSNSASFTYESARHKALMDEYARLSSRDQFAAWGKKAPAVAAYMHQTLARVASGIEHEKVRSLQEQDKKQKRGIEMATMQLENFYELLKNQLDHLTKVMEGLPSGSVRNEYEALIKPWSPNAETPYIRIRVSAAGDVEMDGKLTNLASLAEALGSLAQVGGLVLYSRDASAGVAPPAVAEQIIRLVMENRLPIRLCERADFSDAIDENARLRVSS